MKTLLLFILFVVSIEANYCIQVESSLLSTKDLLIKKVQGKKYDSFRDVRVEEREPYAVLRVGDYKHYKEALLDIWQIRKEDTDAYIRKCDFKRDRIFFIKNDTHMQESSIVEQEAVVEDENLKNETFQEESTLEEENASEEVNGADSSSETNADQQELQGVYDNDQAYEDTDTIAQENAAVKSNEQTTQEYTAFEALSQAYIASNEGNQAEAYHFFDTAIDKCSDASIYDKACMGAILNAPLRRKNIDDPYYVTLYGMAMWYKRAYKPETVFQKNFNDTVYQLKMRAGRYMDEKKKLSLYLFAHLDGDVNSKAGDIPVIYSDNYTGAGIGADYKITPSSRLFVETSFENNTIHKTGDDNTQFDYRVGADFYKRWGPATNLSCSYNPIVPLQWFSDLYAAAVFYSRYNNNIIMQASGRLGINLLTYRMSSLGAYAYVGVTADADGDYYNNIMEVGPGLEYKPYETIPFAIRTEYRFSKFFKNVPERESDRFNTFLIYGIFYFEQ